MMGHVVIEHMMIGGQDGTSDLACDISTSLAPVQLG